MLIKTERLVIRDIKTEDEVFFVKMAEDGTLNDVGFEKNCSEWMSKWIVETKELVLKNQRRRCTAFTKKLSEYYIYVKNTFINILEII